MTKTVTHISLALLALLASAVAPTRAIGGNPRAHRSSSVLLGNGMHVDMSRTPSPLTTSLVFSGADSLRGSRHVLRQELQGFADVDQRGRPESDEGGPARRSALEVAAEGLFDVFGFEVGGETRPLVGRATHKLPSRLDFFFGCEIWLRVSPPRTRLTTRLVRTRAASASFDPLCEFVNPLLPVEDQLECGQGVDEDEELAPYDDEYGEYEA